VSGKQPPKKRPAKRKPAKKAAKKTGRPKGSTDSGRKEKCHFTYVHTPLSQRATAMKHGVQEREMGQWSSEDGWYKEKLAKAAQDYEAASKEASESRKARFHELRVQFDGVVGDCLVRLSELASDAARADSEGIEKILKAAKLACEVADKALGFGPEQASGGNTVRLELTTVPEWMKPKGDD